MSGEYKSVKRDPKDIARDEAREAKEKELEEEEKKLKANKKKYCESCIYYSNPKNPKQTIVHFTCDYILMTGHRRPCKPGKECHEQGIYRKRTKSRKVKGAYGEMHLLKIEDTK